MYCGCGCECLHLLLPYLPSRLIVVEIHQPSGIFLNLPSVHEPAGELHAVFDVGRAATPLPALFLVVVALFLAVAAAVAEVSLAAGRSHCVSHPSGGDGIRERSLLTAWEGEGWSC